MAIFTGAHLVEFLASVTAAVIGNVIRAALRRRRRRIALGEVSDEKRAELRGVDDDDPVVR